MARREYFHAHTRAEQPSPPDRAATDLAAAISCQARGCTCTPELRRRHIGGPLYVLDVLHDDNCPAIASTDGR